jgi:hypothetical protein
MQGCERPAGRHFKNGSAALCSARNGCAVETPVAGENYSSVRIGSVGASA